MNDHNSKMTKTKHLNNSTRTKLVLIHGWGMNQGVWANFVPLLQDLCDAEITCIDLPGFGDNHQVMLKPYNIETVSEWLVKRLPDNSILVGWSLGGLISQYLAFKYQDKFIAHIQLCSTSKFVQEGLWRGIKSATLTMFSEQLQEDHSALLQRFLAIQCMGLAQPKRAARDMYAMISNYPKANAETLSESLQILTSTDLRETMKEVELPSLWIFGRLDSLVPSQISQWVSACLPLAHTVTIAKASHAPFISHAEQTAQLIVDFVEQNRPNT